MSSSAFFPSPPAALSRPGSYRLESDWKLAEQVRRKLMAKDLDIDVRPVPELEEMAMREGVAPLELLLGLGKTTSALPGLADPGAGGLPGLTALRTASRWAIIRYLWAFAEHRPELRLSDLTDQVRHHQRTLFSEQFGIAVATDLVEQLILARPAQVVDADAVSYDRMLGTELGGLGSHRPDYFWYGTEAGKLSEVLVVEVKGTSGPRARSIEQLCRGVQQVLVPSQISGVAMRRIVVGVTVAGRRLSALALEVGEPDADLRRRVVTGFLAEESAGDAAYPPEPMEHYAAGPSTPMNSENVRRAAIELNQARLLTYAGVPVLPDAVWVFPREIRNIVGALEAVDTEGTTFRCETTRIALGAQTLKIRTGVAEDLLIVDGPQAAEERRSDYSTRRQGNGYTFVPGASRSRPQELLNVVTSPDGCMLSVTLDGTTD